jgi:hypothetical protein
MPPDDTSSHPEDQSEIKAAEFPAGGLSSKIPEYLLEGKSEAEIYILKEVSKMSQFIEWSAPLILDNNLQARKTNGRVKGLEGWRLKLTTGWGMVLTAITAILALIGGIEGLITLATFVNGK